MNKYQRAQERIAAGLWTIDAAAGVVHGTRGPIGSRTSHGYIFLSMAPVPPCASNQNVYAHKVIWESVHGPVPVGMEINHINGVKHDNGIANLELVTASENVQHAVDTGLLTHLHGEQSPNARVTQVQVNQIRARSARGETQRSIAHDVGLSRQQVGRIIRGERWASVAA